MKDSYTYPAIFDYSEKGSVQILFPDFDNGSTYAPDGCDPVVEAQDWLALVIAGREDERESLPTPESAEIKLEAGQKLVYINVWMPYHRTKQKVVYTKKTLTIPVWLDILAKQNNVNFSETLVEGLKRKLNIEA